MAPKKSLIYSYYTSIAGQTKWQCSNCDSKIAGIVHSLEKHLQSMHKDEFKKYSEEKSYKSLAEGNSEASKAKQPKITNFTTGSKLMPLCVQLAVDGGRPFSMFDDDAMKEILNLAKTTARDETNITAESVKNAVRTAAKTKRETLKKMLKNRTVHFSLDFATCQHRSFFGLNVQLNNNTVVEVHNLLCREVHESHTGENIAKWIKDGQNEYSISDNQILGLSVDSASNITLGVDLFIEKLQYLDEDNDLMQVINFETTDIDQSFQIVEQTPLELGTLEETSVRVHCVVHRLQLGINDVLSGDKTLNKLLVVSKKLSAKLRNPLLRIQLQHEGLNMAILDQETRWSSSFRMLGRLLQLENFCKNQAKHVPGLHLSEIVWKKLKELYEALAPVAELTQQLQSEKLDVTQFVSFWKTAMYKLEKVDNITSKKLRESIRKREKLIFSNKIVISSIYLDKRFSFLLKPDEIKIARNFIYSVSTKQKILNGSSEEMHENLLETSQDKEDSFEKAMQELAGNSTQPQMLTKDKLSSEMSVFEKADRLKTSESIMTFWKNRTNDLPVLSSAAIDIISAPVTEVSVERLFSNLNFILNKHRSVMSASLVEDILFLRMNRKFSNAKMSS